MKELIIYSPTKDNQTPRTVKAKLKYTEADDEGERTKGLMFVKNLPKNQGMLFVFPDEEPRSFWMKNTFIPLDMIFFDSTFKIQNIVKHAKPHDTTPTEPSEPCKYVLEVHAGFVDENGVVVGDEVEID